MNTRPQFLVHWTGKDINRDIQLLTAENRTAYIQRLCNILAEGFWMTKPNEKLHGNNASWVSYEAFMTCFTEVRLSQAGAHASLYGLLGVAVSREFVLDRFGGPVHYVRNHPQECVVGNIQEIHKYLRNAKENELILSYFGVNVAFLKSMSNEGTDDYKYLDENEWRIVHTYTQEKLGRIKGTGVKNPLYKIPLQPQDIRLVVFPDMETRKQALRTKAINKWFSRTDLPPFLTVEECAQF